MNPIHSCLMDSYRVQINQLEENQREGKKDMEI